MSLQEAISRVQKAAEADTGEHQGNHAKLLEEIHRLRLAAEKPDESIMRLRWEFMAAFSVRFAIEYGILQSIAAKAGKPVPAAELSKETGADELLIVRTMRLVTYHGVCEEVAHGTYASNERTRFLTGKAILGGFNHIYDFGFKTVEKVPELIRTNQLHQFPSGPVERSPIQHTFGDSMFGVLSREPRRKRIFDDYMEARHYSKDPRWFEIFPAGQELHKGLEDSDNAALLVDVGGGKGHDIALFRQRFPNLPGKLILQDLPHTFASLPAKPEGISLMEHDFFTDQPIKGKYIALWVGRKSILTYVGARLYFLRGIMHDWSDDKCIEILRHIVAAMTPEYSRLLIDDFVVPATEVDWLTASLDLCMWLFFSGIERTMSQWQKLFDAVNLEVVQVWSTALSKSRVIELRVRQR